MTLFICEKGSQAEALASVMGLKRDGRGYKGSWKGKEAKIVYLSGHIMSLYDLKEYLEEEGTFEDFTTSGGKLDWRQLVERKKVPYFPKEYKKKVKEPGKFERKTGTDYAKVLKDVVYWCRQADEIVLAPDPDDEGVTLAMEVVDHAKAADKVVGMVKLNALEAPAIRKALESVDPGKWKLHYAAGKSRAEYDWAFGINMTIIASVRLGAPGKPVHIGGVKTPTLRMVVDRDREIENHKKRYLHYVEALVEKDGAGVKVSFPIDTEDKSEAESLAKKITDAGRLKVEKHDEKEMSQEPPLPFSMTDIQSFAGRKGYKLEEVKRILQSLYEKKMSSYPRSECNYYSSDLFSDVPKILAAIKKDSEIGTLAEIPGGSPRKNRAFNDKEVDKYSHTALSPLSTYNESSISDREAGIWRMISRRFLAQLYPKHRYLNISGTTEFGGRYGEKVNIESGWHVAEGTNPPPSERSIPKISAGESLKVVSVEVKSKETKPRPRFTETSLPSAMKNVSAIYSDEKIKKLLGTGKDAKGIGTPATRADIVKALITGGYLEVQKGKIVSTPKGRKLIDVVGDYISHPMRRAELEGELSSIREGEGNPSDFRRDYEAFVLKCVEEVESRGKGVRLVDDRDSGPSPKMKKYAQSIAAGLGDDISKILDDREALKKYIDENKDKKPKFRSLSDKQRNVLKKHAEDPEIKKLASKKSLTEEEFAKAKEALDKIFASWRK